MSGAVGELRARIAGLEIKRSARFKKLATVLAERDKSIPVEDDRRAWEALGAYDIVTDAWVASKRELERRTGGMTHPTP